MVEVARGKVVRELGIAEERVEIDLLARAAAHLHAVDEDLDDSRQLRDRELRAHGLLERLDELLLTRDPVEVRVRVPVAGVVESGAARQLLVARLDVDLRVARAKRVVVAAIDVDIDAVDLVDELLEAVEVDGDHVVDLEVSERLHGRDGAGRAAEGECLVELAAPRRGVGVAARMVDLEIAREREQRERVRPRVGANEHDGVG